MKQPIEPKKEDCCGSGCNPCIFDVYDKQLKLYNSFKDCGEKADPVKQNAISQLEYCSYQVIQNIEICKEHRLLLFKLNKNDKHVFWSPGEHFLVKYSSKKQSCTRAFTPIKIELPNFDDAYDFAVIVKRYHNGLVSNYLCNLNIGDMTMWRGPYGNYHIDSNKFNRIIMLAQGTGIAPFFSIIKHILNEEENMTRVSLFYCCKSIETALLRNELYLLKSYWNFDYQIHLSEKSEAGSLKYQEQIVFEKLTIEHFCNLKPFIERDQFLLCGSEEFMKYFARCLQQQNILDINIVRF